MYCNGVGRLSALEAAMRGEGRFDTSQEVMGLSLDLEVDDSWARPGQGVKLRPPLDLDPTVSLCSGYQRGDGLGNWYTSYQTALFVRPGSTLFIDTSPF